MMLVFSIALSLALTGPSTVSQAEAADVPASSALCSLVIPGYPNPLYGWKFADRLVEHGKYVKAAQAYYKFFRCGSWLPINPIVLDAGQYRPFDLALRHAAAGEFSSAVTGFKQILKALPQFGEARFFMGVFQWSDGRHAEARATWRGTITAPYFAQPCDDGDCTPDAVTAAKKFLRWSSIRT